jgi:3-hydroxy acid dehydrogenase/malonic semialdehyde reductase
MRVLVTGATSGLGEAIVRRFVGSGARVIACGRRLDRLQALENELGSQLTSVKLDVRDKAEVAEAIAALNKESPQIDVLINNAGLALGMEAAQNASLENWEEMVDTNIKGTLYVTHAILPAMVASGHGHVVNIGSAAGEWPYLGSNVYGASKAFLRQLSQNLRADLLGTPIRVTNIEPGLCGGTEFWQVRLAGDTQKAADVYAGVQALTPEDVADTVHWVVSRPAHVNINAVSLMPVCQGFSSLNVVRQGQSVPKK